MPDDTSARRRSLLVALGGAAVSAGGGLRTARADGADAAGAGGGVGAAAPDAPGAVSAAGGAGGAGTLAAPGAGAAAGTADAVAASPWDRLRTSVFGDRPIDTADAAGIVSLEAPARAEDAAIVPIAIRSPMAQSADRFIRQIVLVIDRNPSPVSARMQFTPQSGRVDVETRVRIEQNTTMRAITEMNDGRLYMVTRQIKAAGGCSAPAGKDAKLARATLGQIRLRVDPATEPQQPGRLRVQISHPNDSGLAMDQLTRLYPPPFFIRDIDVRLDGVPVFSIETDFTISENPNFRVQYLAIGPGRLTVRATDTEEHVFEAGIDVGPVAAVPAGAATPSGAAAPDGIPAQPAATGPDDSRTRPGAAAPQQS